MEELKTILQIAGQGGMNAVVLIIWYFTFTRWSKSSDEMYKNLMQVIKDDQEYKTMLAGILMRVEEKLSRPVICPITRGDDHVH